jgi:ATPase subunit of ABC transporter with duplicated ATPase domains
VLIARNLTKSFGPTLVLDDVSVTVGPGHRVGVLGPNGVGKSTLLRLLAGAERPDAGSVERAPADLTVGYMSQEVRGEPGETLLAHLARRTGVAEAEREMDTAQFRMTVDAGAVEPYLAALSRFQALGGDDLHARGAQVCRELGLPGDALHREIRHLSGGQRAKAALAAVALARFGVLLLDEPTNDLDLDGLARLEAFVDGFPGGIVLVSHDRAFLDRTVRHLLEIDPFTRRVSEFAGAWSDYIRQRDQRERRRWDAFERYEEERKRLTALARQIRVDSSVAARKAKRRPADNDKAIRFARVTRAENSATKARTFERRLARMDVAEKPREPWRLRMDLAPASRGADVVVLLEGVVVERDSFRLGPIDLELRRGDRMALVGPNGSGKTTLLGAVLGTVPLAAGSRRLGAGVVPGEVAQDRRRFDADQPLVDAFRAQTGMPAGDARTLLAKFDLGADDALRPGRELSPGERTRATLAVLAALRTNLLVLDEPTNHLDIPAIEELERALAAYPGTFLLATHDRQLLANVGITRTLNLG